MDSDKEQIEALRLEVKNLRDEIEAQRQVFGREQMHANRQRDAAIKDRDALREECEALRQRLFALSAEHEFTISDYKAILAGVATQQKALTNGALPLEAIEAFRLGTIDQLSKRLQKALLEREWLLDNLQSISDAIQAVLQSIMDEAVQERETEAEKRAALVELKSREGLTYIAESWLNLLVLQAEDAYFDLLPIAHASKEHTQPKEKATDAVHTMIFMSRAAERAHLNNEIMDKAIADAHALPTVAIDIFAELENFGTPEVATLSRLSPEWIEQSLTRTPRPATLCKGLKIAHQWNLNGQPPQTVFAELAGIGVRTLRDYIQWYEAIEALTQEKPKFAGFLPGDEPEQS